jgi:hypothetical protein
VKPKVYLETTIPSLLTAWPSRDVSIAGQQQTTRDWWERRRLHFKLHISELVLEEIGRGEPVMAAARQTALKECAILEALDEAQALGEAMVQAKLIPIKAAADALHIATATVHGMDFLLTWNCRHIANAAIADRLRSLCEKAGYRVPTLCTPYELMIELE